MTPIDEPDELDAYLGMAAVEIARLVLCLLIEEALRRKLAEFRRPDGREWAAHARRDVPANPLAAGAITPAAAP